VKAKVNEYRLDNLEKVARKKKEWREGKGKEWAENYKAEYYKENSEDLKQYSREYHHANKEAVSKRSKKYRSENREIIAKRSKEYRDNNVEKLREQRRRTRKNNPDIALRESLRGRIRSSIKNNTKSKRTMELIGCTIDFVRKHLEDQFKEGMSWDNHAIDGWHIDHITPVASFDLSKPEEQKKCFHYTNLQPLWWWENLRKSDKCE
jgi:hypothetical protein